MGPSLAQVEGQRLWGLSGAFPGLPRAAVPAASLCLYVLLQ